MYGLCKNEKVSEQTKKGKRVEKKAFQEYKRFINTEAVSLYLNIVPFKKSASVQL